MSKKQKEEEFETGSSENEEDDGEEEENYKAEEGEDKIDELDGSRQDVTFSHRNIRLARSEPRVVNKSISRINTTKNTSSLPNVATKDLNSSTSKRTISPRKDESQSEARVFAKDKVQGSKSTKAVYNEPSGSPLLLYLVLFAAITIILTLSMTPTAWQIWQSIDNHFEITCKLSPGHSYVRPEEYAAHIDQLSQNFTKQHKHLWLMIRNVGRSHLQHIYSCQKQTVRPLAFLIANYEGKKDTLNCFLKQVASAFTNKPYQQIESSDFQTLDPHVAKLKLDEEVLLKLSGNQKLLIIKDIEKLPFEAASLFMSYGDAYSDLAKFPQSSLLLTMTVPHAPAKSYKEEVHNVEKHFHQIYKDVNINMVAPLWTRMGDGAVVLRAEEQSVLENVCF